MTKNQKPARDVATEITDIIVEKLEQGLPPWQRPWRSDGSGGRPLRHCGVPYTGINALYLWAIADSRGYRSRYWMTYRQATELGAQVRRGETGSISVYYSTFKRTERDPVTGDQSEKNGRFLRWYVVFNADQIDGLPPHFYPGAAPAIPVLPSTRQDAIDRFFAALPGEVRHGGNQAYFNPTFDFIQMPPKSSFKSMDLYCSTLGHEYAHWTGAASRLGRVFGKRFGDQA